MNGNNMDYDFINYLLLCCESEHDSNELGDLELFFIHREMLYKLTGYFFYNPKPLFK